MSRIDELIAELAPGGVRHLTLSEVAEYSPTRVDAADLDETNFVGVDNLVADKGGRVDASYPPNTARLTAYESSDILLGNIRPYLKKVWIATNSGGCSGDVLAVRILRKHRDSLDPVFLYYLLSSDSFFAYNMQHAKGAKMPRGSKSAILSYRIPVPPLEVQREIVRVLDQFTQLEAELEAELDARLRQYEYYARELMAEFDNEPHRAIGEVLYPVKTARGVQRSEYGIGSTIPIIDQGQAPIAGYTDDETLRVPAGEYIVFGDHTRAVKWVDFDFAPGADGIKVFRPAADCLLRYAYFAFKQLNIPNRGYNRHWTVARELLIPVPTLEQQRRVVDTLDQFEALVGVLIAELAARRKQFEYYRDKLLTFEEAAV